MIVPINPYHLKVLKKLTLSVVGIKNISPMDCRVLSFSIMKKTNLSVSETTLKRFFGFAVSKFNPSFFTLTALSVYCGYQGWEEFVKSQPAEVLADDSVIMNSIGDPLMLGLLETSLPTVILKADVPNFTIITYNKSYEEATFTQKRDVRGMTLWKAFHPEKAGGYGPTLLLEAFHEAINTQRVIQMQPLHYNIPSAVPNVDNLSWWDIKIAPIAYNDVVRYLVVNTYNITDKILHQDAIEQAIMRELTLAEDLAKTNVQLSLANRNLAESHEELTTIKNQLEEFNKNLEQRVFDRTIKLFESEVKQRELIYNAPVAIAIIKGPHHVIETANKKIIQYWDRTDKVINKPLAVALPELKGQPFIEILDEVGETGIAYSNPELRAFVNFNGILQPRYYDMVYQPIQHKPGITDSIFIVAVDITEHVIARKRIEQSESMLRLAVTAANIGTWTFEPETRVMNYNPIFAELLGWDSDEIMTYEEAVGQVTEEFREKLVQVIQNAIANGGDYDVTYAQRRFNDGRVIWLRSTGKITADDSGEHRAFSGVIREIANYDSAL